MGVSSSETTQSEEANGLASLLPKRELKKWPKHKDKHRTLFSAPALKVDYSNMLGDGTYGEVFMGDLVGPDFSGMRAVAKRAKDGVEDPDDPAWRSNPDGAPDADERDSLAAQYLQTEAYINDLVTEVAPRCAAPYLGLCHKAGKDWLVFEYLRGETLEDLLVLAEKEYSLRVLAAELGVSGFVDDDVPSLRRLVNVVAEQLLECCRDLEMAGVAHRDIKPYNLYVTGGQIKLIDFGSAAAMGVRHRRGYDYNKSPCDPRYAPPEQFIDEGHWAKFDVYCVGLILVRVLFPPLWGGQHFDEFSDSYHAAAYDLDAWLERIIMADVALSETVNKELPPNPMQSIFGRKPRDQEYVDLAEESCNFPDDGSLLNMCSIKEGLEVLNVKDGGVCWDTLRQVLSREPAHRMGAEAALRRVREARQV